VPVQSSYIVCRFQQRQIHLVKLRAQSKQLLTQGLLTELVVVAFGVNVSGDFAAGGIEDGDDGIELGQGGFRGFDFESELKGLLEVELGLLDLGGLGDAAFEEWRAREQEKY
jgi:hypothetical protein